MKYLLAARLVAALALGLAVGSPALAAPWKTLVAAPQTPAEELALVDLQRYLAQAGGEVFWFIRRTANFDEALTFTSAEIWRISHP